MIPQSYGASPVKRQRSTSADLNVFKEALWRIVEEQKPMTVRQCYYRATVQGLIDKTEAGYKKVQRVLAEMRRNGDMPYSWLTDTSRAVYRLESFDSPQEAAEATAQFYRKALWSDADCRVEVWLEKDALSGVISDITYSYDIGLFICRGFASRSFLHAAAETISLRQVLTIIYHVGDFDPSGVMAGEKIRDTLHDLTPEAEIHFQRIAVTERQIAELDLPSRPTKESTHARDWQGDSVEVDAIEPDRLRSIVRNAIERHLPRRQWEVLKAAEESERQSLIEWAERA